MKWWKLQHHLSYNWMNWKELSWTVRERENLVFKRPLKDDYGTYYISSHFLTSGIGKREQFLIQRELNSRTDDDDHHYYDVDDSVARNVQL